MRPTAGRTSSSRWSTAGRDGSWRDPPRSGGGCSAAGQPLRARAIVHGRRAATAAPRWGVRRCACSSRRSPTPRGWRAAARSSWRRRNAEIEAPPTPSARLLLLPVELAAAVVGALAAAALTGRGLAPLCGASPRPPASSRARGGPCTPPAAGLDRGGGRRAHRDAEPDARRAGGRPAPDTSGGSSPTRPMSCARR